MRMVIAHLGSGCSVTAVVDGKSADTTMGMRPKGRRVSQANSIFPMSKIKTDNEAEAVRAAVRDGYGQIAQKDASCCSGVSCCGSNAAESAKLAKYVGYSAK